MIIEFNHSDDDPPDSSDTEPEEEPAEKNEVSANKGTLMLDATCALQNIIFPQDINQSVNNPVGNPSSVRYMVSA